MEFQLLGAVAARHDGYQLELGRRQERCLLGLLLLEARRAVPVERLLELLWQDAPPASGRGTLHTYVARLRNRLAPYGVRIVTVGGGYIAEVDPMTVDVHLFCAKVDQAVTISDPVVRATALASALELWQGRLMAGVADDDLRERLSAGLDEKRLSAMEWQAEAELASGSHAALIGPLSDLVMEYPIRERLVELLMLALHRHGRSADALAVYRRLRQELVDELALEPAAELQALHHRILNNDPEVSPVLRVTVPIRRFLPRDITDFTGRATYLADLDAFADEHAHSASTLVISAISGTAGVGKTALAIRWGHRAVARFPDGQLYIDLRGYDRRQPMLPIEAVGQLLRALDVPNARIPLDLEEAAALYRANLADKRVLLVLDNAGSVDQVRPLLPTGSGSLVLVTSRDRLGGLVARDGARVLTLDTLSDAETIALIQQILGADRVAAEPEAVLQLAGACGHLPLAVRIAAANLAAQPGLRIADYVQELASGDRLAALSVPGDPDNAVRAVFDWSYRSLQPLEQHLFGLLGLIPGRDFTVAAAASLTGVSEQDTATLLERLISLHLVIEHVIGRYTMHDLIRDYARSLVSDQDSDAGIAPAQERLLHWYLGRTEAAARKLYPTVVSPPDAGTPSEFDTIPMAAAWLDEERANLIAAIGYASDIAAYRLTWLLAARLRSYLYIRRLPLDLLRIGEIGAAAAAMLADPGAQGLLKLAMSHAWYLFGDMHQAIPIAEHATVLFAQASWAEGEAAALSHVSQCYLYIGPLSRAAEYAHRALDIYHEHNNPAAGYAIDKLGIISMLRGDLPAAVSYLEQSLELARGCGSGTHDEAVILSTLANAYRQLGQHGVAMEHVLGALAVYEQTGHPHTEAHALTNLARIHRDQGRYDEAEDAITLALAKVKDSGDDVGELQTRFARATILLNVGELDAAISAIHQILPSARLQTIKHPTVEMLIALASAHCLQAQLQTAMAYANEALEIATGSEYRLLEGEALTEIAAILLRTGHHAAAAETAQQALKIHAESGHPPGEERVLAILSVAQDGQNRGTT